MKCKDFTEWLQQRLDERSELKMPPDVHAHTSCCESCSGQLEAWEQISNILPTENVQIFAPAKTTQTTHRSHRPLTTVAGIAAALAAVLLVAFVIGRNVPTDTVSVVKSATAPHDSQQTMPSTTNVDRVVDPATLWRQIQNRDWIAQTMPAVQSVRDSVAPAGRSLVHAATILATGGRDQTS